METSAHIKYLLANEQDNRWGVVVTTTGYQIIEPQTSYPPSNHPVRYLFSVEKGRLLNEYQLIYISRGDGQFVSASHKETSFEGGGKFILLFPGEWHSYRPSPKTGWHEYWIGFTGPDIDRKVGAKFLDPHRPLFNVGYHEDIINLYKLALRTAQEQGSGFQQILAGIVNLLLGSPTPSTCRPHSKTCRSPRSSTRRRSSCRTTSTATSPARRSPRASA